MVVNDCSLDNDCGLLKTGVILFDCNDTDAELTFRPIVLVEVLCDSINLESRGGVEARGADEARLLCTCLERKTLSVLCVRW